MSGSVVDESTQAVPGATITIVNEATGEERTGLSNEVGDFTFPALVAGPYTIRVSMDGFRPLEVKRTRRAGEQPARRRRPPYRAWASSPNR